MTLSTFPGRGLRVSIALFGSGVVLIAAILLANEVVVRKIRNDTLDLTSTNLKSQATVLSSEVDRSLKLLDLALSSLSDHIARLGVNDSDSLKRAMGNTAFYRLLQEKKNGLTRVEAITLISNEGKLINFSRYWPIPDVNVADRDYFKVLKDDASQESLISAPVQNRGSGTWNVYLARRLNTPDGDFMGLLLGAIALDSYESYFKTIALQNGSAVTMLRKDGLLLARHPHSPLVGSTLSAEAQIRFPNGSSSRETSAIDGQRLIIAANMLANFPVRIVVSQTEAGALQNWRSFAILSYSMAVACSVLVLSVLFLVTWWSRKREQLSDRLLLQNALFDAATNNMAQGLCLFDANSRLVFANNRYRQIYNVPEELVRPGIPLRDMLQFFAGRGETGDLTVDQHVKLIPGEARQIFKLVDGRTISIQRNTMPDGGWVATHDDVTAQKRTEHLVAEKAAELEITNARFDAALRNMMQGLCMFDCQKRLVIWNDRYAELYQLPAELLRVGTPHDAIIADRVARGILKGKTSESAAKARIAALGQLPKDARSSRIDEFADGRFVLITRQPMPEGGWLATHEDITEKRSAEAEIIHLARHDVLTGLANRAEFNAKLEEASKRVRRMRRHHHHRVDALQPLDKFKQVNDSLGHPAGDKLLVEVAHRLSATLRETDVLARLGGDEFAIIQEGGGSQHEGAVALALRIIQSITAPFDLNGHEARIGTSVGIAMAPEHGVDPADMVKKADLALYEVKAAGRNDFQIFRPSMLEAVQSQQAAEDLLRRAIEREELELHYQPLIDARTGEVCGAEALVRWRHPEKGLIGPDQFIRLAESTGLIVPLGNWVLQRACADATTWPANIQVAVNISAAQLKDANLFDVILCTLVETGLPPDRLELEITETVLTANQEKHLASIRQLKNLGISIAIDDFGTGYSSMTQLTLFPFDKIKIDKSFTQGALTRRDHKAIVESTLLLARGLDLRVTAEGIETQEQLRYMHAAGVDFLQGYMLGRPVALSQFDALNSTVLGEMVA